MNNTIKCQLNHRTIREFKEKEVPKDLLEKFVEVIQRTASSTGMQTCSVIRVTDKEVKDKISKVCGQEYVARAPELFIFIVDAYRNNKIAEEISGKEFTESHDMDRFFQGWTDAVLAAQNLTNAIESEKLGAVYLGSILNDTNEIIDILNLPKLTFPVLGVAFGYPNQEPQLKPRMDMNLRLFENEYKAFDNYKEEIKEYDEEMQTYYDLREANKRVDSFSRQVISRLENTLESRAKILNSVVRQGFDLKTEK
ncbi:NADPH-dependent oxidoreductase [Miniphocaeibacter massiliensis]|uniref:NADPH-dependent oxidoreductase n=1 Tax=Miniphocaeibacter massiliensis TaxID=2041841 RepID=UPI000C1C27A1|nr:NADPH-dependent oxidoreductase [Miniphocaeibacter massiliensis]